MGSPMVFAQNAEKSSTAETIKKVSTSDQFLSFVLSKAEKYSEKAEEGIGKAVDAIATETPKVIEEFLIWRAWKHGMIGFGCLGLFFLINGVGLYLCYRNDCWEMSMFLTLTLFLLIPICEHILNFIQVIVAPRVYIIEQAINLIK